MSPADSPGARTGPPDPNRKPAARPARPARLAALQAAKAKADQAGAAAPAPERPARDIRKMYVSQLSDRELAELVRGGQLAAAQELWTRHAAYGLAVAKGLAPDDDWESISNRAWAFILDEPSESDFEAGWRPYLYLVIRAVSSAEPPGGAADAMLTSAFYDLPAESRQVLWYGHVESLRPAEIATFTGADEKDIAAMLSQARKQLRREWVTRHVHATTKGSTCRWVWAHSEDYVAGTLSDQDREWADRHLETCAKCRPARSDAIDVASRLNKIVLPAITGAGGAASLLSYIATNGPKVRTFAPMPEQAAELFATPPPAPDAAKKKEDVAKRYEPPAADKPAEKPDRTPEEAPKEPPGEEPGGKEPGGTETGRKEPGTARPAPAPVSARDHTLMIIAFIVTSAMVLVLVTAVITAGPWSTNRVPPPVATSKATSAAAASTTIDKVDTGVNNNLFPVVSGTAPAGSSVLVRIDDTKMTVTADHDGNWDTQLTLVEGSATRGQITATSDADPVPATAMYEIAPAPVIAYETRGTTTTWTVTGLPNAGVEVLVGGVPVTTAVLDETGTGEPDVPLTAGNHFVQVRYAEGDRVGISSATITVTSK